ncbi:MAG: hypothetical protein WA777_17630 [Rhodanobacter sp.]
MSEHEIIIQTAVPGIQLYLKVYNESIRAELVAMLWSGEFPYGRKLMLSVSAAKDARIDTTGRSPDLWLGSVNFDDLPWLELLKVADFLKLDIPLLHPVDAAVPA